MNNSSSATTRKNIIKIALIALGFIAIVGLIGYVTISALKKAHAPTISTNSQSAKDVDSSQTATPTSPAQAQALADAAVTQARAKVAQGDQKGALTEYQAAYNDYQAAGNTARAKDVQFSIDSIKLALAAEQNITKPTGGKTSSKQ